MFRYHWGLNLSKKNVTDNIIYGNLYSKDGTVLIMYLQEGDVINIPEGVKTITNKATKSIKAKYN